MIHFLEWTLALSFAGMFGWVVWDAVQRYATLPGNTPTFDRVSHAFHDSATVFVMRASQLVSTAIGAFASYAVLFDSPAVQGLINSYLGPRGMTFLMAFSAIAGELARRRTL